VEAHKAGAPEEEAGVEYELCGVVTHAESTIQSGHYYSFVRHVDGTHWLRCDDSEVTGSSFQRAVTPASPTETPYLLFYMRSSALQHAAVSAVPASCQASATRARVSAAPVSASLAEVRHRGLDNHAPGAQDDEHGLQGSARRGKRDTQGPSEVRVGAVCACREAPR
jgi:hypothetical protein